jgi:hypothetical protein
MLLTPDNGQVIGIALGVGLLWLLGPEPGLYWSGIAVVTAGFVGAIILGHRLFGSLDGFSIRSAIVALLILPTPVGYGLALASLLRWWLAIAIYVGACLLFWRAYGSALRSPYWAPYFPIVLPFLYGAFWVPWGR